MKYNWRSETSGQNKGRAKIELVWTFSGWQAVIEKAGMTAFGTTPVEALQRLLGILQQRGYIVPVETKPINPYATQSSRFHDGAATRAKRTMTAARGGLD